MAKPKDSRQSDQQSLKAEQYRVRAEELFAIAQETKDKNTSETLVKLSDDYLKMASQMDQIVAINRQLHIRPGK